MNKTAIALSALCLATASALSAPTWDTGTYSRSQWAPSSGNVIAGATEDANAVGSVIVVDGLSHYGEGGKNMTQDTAALTDGIVPGSSGPDYSTIVGISGGTLTWLLPSAVNLTEIRVFTRWGDGGRDGIGISAVAVREVGASEWTTLGVPAVSYGMGDNGTIGYLRDFLTDGDATLADNIDGLRLTFGGQDNGGTGYVEIEALGVPATAVWHTVSVGGISAWRATVSGSVGSCGGGTSSDIYFAYGTDASSLVPALVAEDVAEGDSFTLPQLTGLTAGTTYSYASYSVSDTGVQSSLLTGTFTTAAPVPVEASATPKYAGTAKAALEGVVSSLGEEGAAATFYFAFGTDASSLVPAAYTNGLAAGETFEIPLTGLEPATAYAFACYAVNNLGAQSATITGTFTTSDGSAPRWLGLVSENWSDDLNWDTEVAPTANSTVARIILDYPYGCHPPANLDIEGLAITRLRIASNRDYSFTMDGAPFTCWGIEGEGSAAGDVTILNDIDVRDGGWGNFSAGLQNAQTVRLMGSLSSPSEGITIRTSEPGGNLVLGGENTFSGRVESHVGSLGFFGEENLGQPPAEPTPGAVQQNWGAIRLLSPKDRYLGIFDIHANRGFAGIFTLYPSTELLYNGVLGSKFQMNASNEGPYRHVHLGGSRTGTETLEARLSILTIAESDTAFGETDMTIYSYRGAVWDFNGHDSPVDMRHYSEGGYIPNFINNDTKRAVTLPGEIVIDLDQGTPFFGGVGDIVHTGAMRYTRTDCSFRKSGPGTLSLAGDDYNWQGGSSIAGGTTVFDYSAHNTARTFNGNLTLSDGRFIFRGSDSEATTVALGTLSLGDGYNVLEAVSGSGGLSLTLGALSNLSHARLLDLRVGEGATLAMADGATLATDAAFGAVHPSLTWDHGRSWAALAADGTFGPLPDSAYAATLDNDVLWDAPAGTSAVSGGEKSPNGIRFADPTGGATVTLGSNVLFRERGSGNDSCGILVTPDVGGPVSIEGSGNLRAHGGNHYLTIHNNSESYPVRISARLEYNNNNGLYVVGPGTTLLDNDSNGFFNGPFVFGGGTLQFTSIADNGNNDWNAQRSSLGNAFYNGPVGIGNGCTLEYVGTTEEGHASNRQLKIYGISTLKASGVGPLHLTGATAVTAQYSATRLILDGEGEGEIDGAINSGTCGSVVKRGSGTWTLASDASSYEYPTEVEEGVLRVTGALPSTAIVHENGTLALGEGAVVKRHLETSGTIRYEADSDAAVHAPARVWGKATLSGVLDVQGRLAEPTVVLVADNGIEGSFSSASSKLQVKIVGNTVVANPSLPTLLLFQ